MATKNRTASATALPGSGYGALQRMNRDWEVLSRDPRAADRIACWAEEDDQFAGVRTPQDVVERLVQLFRRGDWAGHDQALAALLRRATTDDFDGQVAWRVAVRILLPKAILMAKTQLRPGVDWEVIFSTVLSALFEVVRTYPLARRPRAIFANLSMDTLMLAQSTLADDFDDRRELRKITRSLAPLAGDPQVPLIGTEAPDPLLQFELADLLAHAAELELVSQDEPELTDGDARTELLALVMWAVDIQALKVSDAQRITEYYLSTSLDPDQAFRTTRAMGTEGARLRQRASRAVRPLRDADLKNGYLATV
ncbi:hypothetical protein [Streptomyces sp. A 4/2]|uniref:hypothetical protein n=1 Tax=Streptomyces sp. A 4/2 TaxID=2934314 RepID=UPI0020245965|nr:hypothetical protein [Streptomyces sp. A 4/2]